MGKGIRPRFFYRIDLFGSIDYKNSICFRINRHSCHSRRSRRTGRRQPRCDSGLKAGILITFGVKAGKAPCTAFVIQHIYPSDTVPCRYRKYVIAADFNICKKFFSSELQSNFGICRIIGYNTEKNISHTLWHFGNLYANGISSFRNGVLR